MEIQFPRSRGGARARAGLPDSELYTGLAWIESTVGLRAESGIALRLSEALVRHTRKET
ncbi:hypothetical protein DICSQDRAFT_156816 [Dichomitus squalens LYAD-421 SS1]|uniref:Uncharacterized protein n=1 Tax=Dichomitus squalens (strain LYAD-421) TaxID=732165 RepID=R7SRG0_DICSQ|nr:uncharacterized protein DICSQDRAFT_156816 [Dichomitus squalens LYAD-421 SS1]EJF58345.1 hypothetical protein DICSQDRAFT_156816 [Dichomitus squalens LYAD-421 SS1]